MPLALPVGLLVLSALAHVSYLWLPRRILGWAATGLTALAWATLLAWLLVRGLTAGQWPLSTAFEFALNWVWLIVSGCLLLELYWRDKRASAFVLILALLVASLAVAVPPEARVPQPLPPALRSIWLHIHVSSSLVGHGLLGVAAGIGVMRLLASRGTRGVTGPSLWLPELEETDYLLDRTVALGFPWLSLGLLSGAIWAQRAWGRYWGWDPKETWSLIAWLWYVMMIHLRPNPRWRARAAAWLAVAGFCIVLFGFVGVPAMVRTLQLDSLHPY